MLTICYGRLAVKVRRKKVTHAEKLYFEEWGSRSVGIRIVEGNLT